MKIVVKNVAGKVFCVECESTDTIAHLEAKLGNLKAQLMFHGKLLGDNFLENMTLADAGVQHGSFILDSSVELQDATQSTCRRHRQRHENDYADLEFKSGWREEQAKALLELLLLEVCKDGTISEGNVTDEAWFRIQNSLNNSMKCNFPIDFLKERLLHYKKLYSLLEETSSPIFNWDCKRNAVTIMEDDSNEEYSKLLLLCGPYIPYFDTLEKEASSSRGEICIQRPSDSNLSTDLGIFKRHTRILKQIGLKFESDGCQAQHVPVRQDIPQVHLAVIFFL